MSLIHQALRDMDPPLATGAAALAPRVFAAPRRNGRGRGPLLAVVAALALAGAGYAAWQSLRGGPQLGAIGMPAAVAAPAPMMATAAAATLPAAAVAVPTVGETARTSDTAVPATAAAPLATAVQPAAPVAPASTAPAAMAAPVRLADAALVPRTDPVARPPALRPRAAAPAAAPARAPASVPAVRPVAATAAIPVEKRFGLFLQTMRDNDLPAAEQHLMALRQDLPRSSVSLLRAEGWYAMARGDTDGAARHYQDILERLPGDEEASINLAGIESRRQRTEVARQILADGVRAHPESESLKSALAGFRAKP
ncbi:lipopolysaccharide assembly protein LapB [Xylophilus sp. Leaf220]|uniref:tetratricopeptide repeat protein n=1 Tax=Xylophilus sp. Leaf220 TaxID=1735686 RepID=UPI0006FB5F76|nr:tetratricopeptide repeat protein [Xylophilus sp. Leaf220]KQM70125.1 hypothetical protein ASE76_09945 [Xylophilus sp. Leaf220]